MFVFDCGGVTSRTPTAEPGSVVVMPLALLVRVRLQRRQADCERNKCLILLGEESGQKNCAGFYARAKSTKEK
jgi:hypothetical protein